MGMGTRQSQQKQEEIWIANVELARSPGHPFYGRLNELLDGEKFDEFAEGLCGKFYAKKMGRPAPKVEAKPAANVVNLMDALKASIGGTKPAAKPVAKAKPAKAPRKSKAA